jgi:hypothetical protein
VGAKIELAPNLSSAQIAQAIDEAERRVRERVPAARVMYLEPDIFRATAPVT